MIPAPVVANATSVSLATVFLSICPPAFEREGMPFSRWVGRSHLCALLPDGDRWKAGGRRSHSTAPTLVASMRTEPYWGWVQASIARRPCALKIKRGLGEVLPWHPE